MFSCGELYNIIVLFSKTFIRIIVCNRKLKGGSTTKNSTFFDVEFNYHFRKVFYFKKFFYTNKDITIIQNGAIFVNAFMSFKVEIGMIYNKIAIIFAIMVYSPSKS